MTFQMLKRPHQLLLTCAGVVLSTYVLQSPAIHASEQVISHAKVSGNPKEELVLDILKLTLSKAHLPAYSVEAENQTSPEDAVQLIQDEPRGQSTTPHQAPTVQVNYQFNEISEAPSEVRMLNWIKDGTLSVMWAGTQPSYEKELIPIRIPIFKGMLGHRIFIIRQGDQARFNTVNTLDDLRRIPLGQGRDWGDTAVLREANMNVVAPPKYKSLFPMLEGGRFDFFPRAIHEPWSEVSTHKELNLTVEKNLLLVYPFAMYFFVAPHNQALADTIETGFRRAIEDGSYDDLLFSHPEIRKTLALANLKERTVFRIPNPNMTDETPINDKSLWLNLDEL